MRFYSVHVPPDESWGGLPPEPERIRFVKDGFSWPALLIPVPWMLWHRLWLALLYSVAFALAAVWINRLASGPAALLALIAYRIFLGVAGNDLRRYALAASGWTEIASSHGDSLDEAELRFFARDDGREREAAEPALDASGRRTDADTVIGVFPEPEQG